MNTHFLTPLQWLTVLTDSIWIPFHPRILLYQRPQGSWTHGTSLSLCRKVNVLAIHTRSHHEYALSKPTAMPNSADWLHLDTFTPMGDALPRTRRLLNTRKNAFAMKASQCSGNFTGQNHKYTFSKPTAVAYSADWLQPDTCPPVECAIPGTQGSSTPGKPVVPQIPVKLGNGKPAQSQFLCAASPSLVYWWSKIWSTESRSPRRNPELNFHSLGLWY